MTNDNIEALVQQTKSCIYWGVFFGLIFTSIILLIYTVFVSLTGGNTIVELRVFSYFIPLFIIIGIPFGIETYKTRNKDVPSLLAKEIQRSLSRSVFIISMVMYLLLWVMA